MPYSIKRTNGTALVNLDDQTIDTTSTSLSLVGHKALNYGRPIAQNFVSILENFAAPTAPRNPLVGQFWYDAGTGTMRFFDGLRWVAILAYDAQNSVAIPPSSITSGMLAAGAVTTHAIATGAITNDKVAPGALLGGSLSDHSLPITKLRNNTPNTVIGFDGQGVATLYNASSLGSGGGGGGGASVGPHSITLDLLAVGSQDALITFDASGNAVLTNDLVQNSVHITGNSGTNRDIVFETNGVGRWHIGANTTVEAGASSGSALTIRAYDDSGVLLSTPLSINRATGAITLGAPITLVRDPISALEASSKQYVDTQIATLNQSLSTQIAAYQGEIGAKILNGVGTPDDTTVGVQYDFYIDTKNILLYGPKSANGWGGGVSLVGPANPPHDARRSFAASGRSGGYAPPFATLDGATTQVTLAPNTAYVFPFEANLPFQVNKAWAPITTANASVRAVIVKLGWSNGAIPYYVYQSLIDLGSLSQPVSNTGYLWTPPSLPTFDPGSYGLMLMIGATPTTTTMFAVRSQSMQNIYQRNADGGICSELYRYVSLGTDPTAPAYTIPTSFPALSNYSEAVSGTAMFGGGAIAALIDITVNP